LSVSQNTDQKTSAKYHKIHRAPLEVSRKIIAFETISNENKVKSEREIYGGPQALDRILSRLCYAQIPTFNFNAVS
ncbi:MAG: hypothetical protein ACHQUC_08200, partial [Chlamydiales bacterium]